MTPNKSYVEEQEENKQVVAIRTRSIVTPSAARWPRGRTIVLKGNPGASILCYEPYTV